MFIADCNKARIWKLSKDLISVGLIHKPSTKNELFNYANFSKPTSYITLKSQKSSQIFC